jgi:hypothetical protein
MSDDTKSASNSDENRAILQENLSRVHNKLDSITADISDIKIMDAVQNLQLGEHMRRSDLLEKRVEQVNARIDPIAKIVASIKTIVAVIAFLLTVPHIERLGTWLLNYIQKP